MTETASSLAVLLRDAGTSPSVMTPSALVGLARGAKRALIETAIESVTNIIKHAPTSYSASIELAPGDRSVELV